MDRTSAQLEVVAGKARGMSILVEDELVVGRLAQGAGRLADDEEISRSHARIAVDAAGACLIEDLGSTNGTYVNGLRISSPVAVAVGDTIELGTTTLVVRAVPEPAGPPTSVDRATPPAGTAVVAGSVQTPDATPEPAAGVAALGLRLEVDFDAREATIQLDGGAEVQLVWHDDEWQIKDPLFRAGPNAS